jgi:hypothetical protein
MTACFPERLPGGVVAAAVRLLYHDHNLYIRLDSAYLNDQLRPQQPRSDSGLRPASIP